MREPSKNDKRDVWQAHLSTICGIVLIVISVRQVASQTQTGMTQSLVSLTLILAGVALVYLGTMLRRDRRS